nr:reverse transcriptase domain-containing protein [Tanacetum cinerariifolium]
MADQCTVAQLLHAPTEGYEDAIVVSAITADNFELKHGLLTLVQNKQFFGHDKKTRMLMFVISTRSHQDSLNSAAGGNFLDKMPRECLAIIESKSKVRYSRNKPVVAKLSTNTSTFGISPDVAELKDMVKALLLDKKSQNHFPSLVKAVEDSCAPAYQAPAPQTQGVSKEDFSAYVKANDAFVNSNSASTSSSGTLPSNTIANPRSDLKAITTRSGVTYDGPQIPPSTSFLPKVVEDEPEVTKDTVNPTNNGNTEDVQPQAVQSESPILTSEPVTSPISEPAIAPIFKDMSFEISFVDALILMPKFASALKALIENKEKLSEMARTLLKEHCSAVLLKKLSEKLGDPSKFLIPCDFSGMAECLALADISDSINLMPFFVWKILSLPDLTPTCMTLELADHSISRPVGVAEDVYVKVGSFFFSADFVVIDFDADPRVPLILGKSFLKTGRALIDLFEGELTLQVGKDAITFNLDQTSRYSANYSDMTAKRIDVINMASFLNDDPSLPPPNKRNYLPEVRKELKTCEAKSEKSSVDEPPMVELKDLPPHLEYAFLEGDDKLPVIIAKDLSVKEKTTLITVLKSHKRAIAWKLSDIKKSSSLVESDIQTNAKMADNRTMAQMLQAHIEGYEDEIVVPPINANNFELKQTLINLVQSNQFTGRQDPHNHLRFFNKNLYNKPSTSSSSLPSNTIPNPKGEAKAITTRSGMSYKEPPIPPTGVNQQKPVEVTTDTEPQNSNDIHPPTVQAEVQIDNPLKNLLW